MSFSFIRMCTKIPNSSFKTLFKNDQALLFATALKRVQLPKHFHRSADHRINKTVVQLVSNQRRSSSVHVSKPTSHKEKDDDSDSDSDTETKHKGESEFWRRKMRTFHGILDINKDGVISYDDYKLLVDRFINLGHLSPSHEEEFRSLIKKMWEERWGSIDPYNWVTTEQYLEDMHHVVNDKSLRKKVHNFLPYLFKAVDNDKNGIISIDEYKLFFQCLNLSSEAAVMSFYIIDENNDGHLSMKEFVKLGREFFTTEDSRKPSKMFWGPLVD